MGMLAALIIGLTAAWAAAAGPRDPEAYVHLGINDVASLDPAWAYDGASHNVIANVYDYLVAYKAPGFSELEPRVAERVPSRENGLVSADGRAYTFPIRKGVRFHEGGEVSPEDVRYSILRFLLTDRASGPSPLLLEPILGRVSTRDADGRPLDEAYQAADRAVTVSGDAVVVRLARPFAPFLTILANFCPVLSKAWCAANGEWDGSPASWKAHNDRRAAAGLHAKANGTGAFRLERWDPGAREVALVRFDGHWRGPARLKRVAIRAVPEFQTRRLMLKAGDADSIHAPRMFHSQLAGTPGVRLVDGLEGLDAGPVLMFTLDLDVKASPYAGSGRLDGRGIPSDFFADADVRKGFACALDYDAYIRQVLRGKGRRAQGIVPRLLIGEKPGLPLHQFDLEKARAHLLRARGGEVWRRGFELSIVVNAGSEAAEAVAGMLKRNVEGLNPRFRVNVRQLQWSTYLDSMNKRRMPVFLAQWQADYPDPHNFVFPFLHSKGGHAYNQGFADPELDRLIEEAAREPDAERRRGLYHRVHELAYEAAYHVVIASGVRYRAEREWVRGWRFSPVFPDSPHGADYFTLWKEGS